MINMLIRKIRTLAHKECCNCIDGKCIENGACIVINPLYPSIHDGVVACDYFLEGVLPIDPVLNRIIWAELLREQDVIRPNERTCAWCGGDFVPNSSRQQYCPHCKPLHERLHNRNKQRSYYQRKRMKSA
jgi:hypothetical protein